MPFPGLAIIGEAINDSIPSVRAMFDAGDFAAVRALAEEQDRAGAAYLDVNAGSRPPSFLAKAVREVQAATAKPLAIDTPDPEAARAALAAYDPARAGGKAPILNSVAPARAEMFALWRVRPFVPILLCSERLEGGRVARNRTAEETHRTALGLAADAAAAGLNLAATGFLVDPGLVPIAGDAEGQLGRVLDSIARIRRNPALAGARFCVGLSNFAVMLPAKCADGTPVRSALESAFLTLAIPLGLDTAIASTRRKLAPLPDGHPALECLKDVVRLGGFDAILRVKEFYSGEGER